MTITALILALLASPGDLQGRGPVILDFHAEWCGPCQQMRPALERLVQKGYPVKSVDIDQDADLAARYQVSSVPTFIVVDPQGRPLARTQGLQPAATLASLYLKARAKLEAADESVVVRAQGADAEGPADDSADLDDFGDALASDSDQDQDQVQGPEPPTAQSIPRPWQTVVRIKVHGNNMLGYGSGTIIYSNDQEALILTCAHIFHMDGSQQQPPSQFSNRIDIDLFDGRLQGPGNQTVRPVQTVPGRAVDYDFTSDVGLIHIRPGRRLPASPVVPSNWQPRPNLKMITVGCSHGNDATAWTTMIANPRMVGGRPGGRKVYEGIECVHAPKQGRSGGGLYTTDGYIAGVCDFADPHNNRGIYASPTSIYRLLDRNRLTALYRPRTGPDNSLLADRRPTPTPAPARPRQSAGRTVRAQSPDGPDSKTITLPRPELLGIIPPTDVASNSTVPRAANRPTWRATRRPSPTGPLDSERLASSDPPRSPSRSARRFATDLKVGSSTAPESLGPPPAVNQVEAAPVTSPAPSSSKWRAVSPAS